MDSPLLSVHCTLNDQATSAIVVDVLLKMVADNFSRYSRYIQTVLTFYTEDHAVGVFLVLTVMNETSSLAHHTRNTYSGSDLLRWSSLSSVLHKNISIWLFLSIAYQWTNALPNLLKKNEVTPSAYIAVFLDLRRLTCDLYQLHVAKVYQLFMQPTFHAA